MRKLVLVVAMLLLAAMVVPLPNARAMTAHSAGLKAAADTHDAVEQVARCRRRGWHGWGWYPCRRYVGPSYRAHRAYSWHRPYRYRYSYGWRHHQWR